MDDPTKIILGKRALMSLSAKDYAVWAGEMLMRGYDSYSLRILSGFPDSTSVSDVEDYFPRCIKELGLIIPDDQTAIRAYACEIARQIVESNITAQNGVRSLYRICQATEYDQQYTVWLDLDDALDSLHAGDFPFSYESATLASFDRIAKQEAERFITELSCPGSVGS